MDWGRAKTILIVTFFILNVLLGFQLYTSRADLLDQDRTPSGLLFETQRLIEMKNIKLPEQVPAELPRLREIVATIDDKITTNEKIVLPIRIRYSPSVHKGTIKDETAFTEIPHLEEYRYDEALSTDNKYYFNQLYKDLPLFDVRLELTGALDGYVPDYKQRYVQIEEQTQEGQEPQRVISPYTALRTLAEFYFPNGAEVVSIRLGYHGRVYNSQSMYMVPYWRFVLKSGEVFYVHAFNGAVE